MMALAIYRAHVPPSPRTDPEIDRAVLDRCRRGDPAAMRELVKRYEKAVFALLSRMLGSGPHVDDLAQETFLRAFRALPDFDPDGAAKPSTWLLTIATRLALDAKKRKQLALEVVDDPPGPSTTPESESERAELGRSIARAAAALPEDQRAVFLLADVHELTMSEIAVAVDAPEATVKSRLFRAREKLRAMLAPLWRDER